MKLKIFTFIILFASILNNTNAQFQPSETGTDVLFTNKKVGIGTNDPGGELEVSNGLDGYIRIDHNDGFNTLRFGSINGGVRSTNWKIHDRHWSGSNQGLVFQNQSLHNILKITQDGNIGIGTGSPTHKLSVTGEIDYTQLTKLDIMENSKAYIRAADIMFGHSTRRGTLGRVLVDAGQSDLHLNFRSDWNRTHINGERIFLTGNTGIGTINVPNDFMLAVNGKIRAKEIKVETGWSDFVFEDDYDLPTLDEVEKYIKTHRHLPEIPSAKEVEENGVELGKMDSKLLQKIEELTLYIIDQEKRIRKLEAINTQLMKERE